MEETDLLVRFLKAWEGFSATPHWDGSGFAIGYGNHYYIDSGTHKQIPVKALDRPVTEEEAERIMRDNLQYYYKISSRLKVTLEPCQRAALRASIYQTGGGGVKMQALYDAINKDPNRNSAAVRERFLALGSSCDGLRRRYEDTALLYATGTFKKVIGYSASYTQPSAGQETMSVEESHYYNTNECRRETYRCIRTEASEQYPDAGSGGFSGEEASTYVHPIYKAWHLHAAGYRTSGWKKKSGGYPVFYGNYYDRNNSIVGTISVRVLEKAEYYIEISGVAPVLGVLGSSASDFKRVLETASRVNLGGAKAAVRWFEDNVMPRNLVEICKRDDVVVNCTPVYHDCEKIIKYHFDRKRLIFFPSASMYVSECIGCRSGKDAFVIVYDNMKFVAFDIGDNGTYHIINKNLK